MEALSAWRGKSLLTACIGVILAVWPASAARAESLTVLLKGGGADRGWLTAGSPACEFAAGAKCRQEWKKRRDRRQSETSSRCSSPEPSFSGTARATSVLSTPPGPTTPPPDNPPAPSTPGPPSSPLTPNTPPTDNVVVIQGNPTPEPASLILALVGSACAGAAVWNRRRKRPCAA